MSGYFTGPSIAFGPSSIEQLGQLGARRALVVVDSRVAPLARTLRVREELEKGGAVVENLPVPDGEPSLSSVEGLVPTVRAFRPDWLIAVGGGSTIDAAKGLWVRFAAPEVPLGTVGPLVELSLRSVARLVAVPTTCGSGSEATWSAHLLASTGASVDVTSRELLPEWALIDPTFLATLPLPTVAATAADALAHALEAWVSAWANPFSDALAAHALRLLLPSLAKIGKHPEDDELRGAMHIGATQAGLAVANAQVGVGHALAHALGAEFGVPHARLVAALLPYEAEFNYPSARDRYQSLAETLGPSAGTSRSAISERLRNVWESVGLPKTLAQAGVTEEALTPRLEGVLDRALVSPGCSANPRVPSRGELRDLMLAAVRGRPVDF